MKIPHNARRADITRVWPSYEAPFNPESNINRNVFSLMPFRNLDLLGAGTETYVNVATYRDGILQNGGTPRWQQRLLLRINMIESAKKQFTRMNNRKLIDTSRPADLIFSGYVINPAAETVVVDGIIHPVQEGWLAFNQSDFEQVTEWDQPFDTVADLKYMIGKISKDEAERQRENYASLGHFMVNGQLMI
jgi:hypothetical protein